MEKLMVVMAALLGLSMAFEFDFNTLMQQGTPIQTSGQAPQPCCSPTQFEGTLSELDSYLKKGGIFHRPKTGLVSELISLSYDGDNKLVALDENIYTSRNRSFHQKVILDFPQRQMYIIRESRCISTKLQAVFKPSCIPNNATSTGSYFLGSGENKVTMNGWQVMFPMGRDEGVVVYASTASDNCLFVSEVHMGKIKDVSFFGVLSLVDGTLGIKDPSVFTPPSSCEQGDAEIESDFMSRMVQRFMQ